MQRFSSDGVEIAFLDQPADGEPGPGDGLATGGDPILLIHGFASSTAVNWVQTGWVQLLARAGRRVVSIDNRGHGHSQKLHRPEDYGAPLMAQDARRLLDHLGIARADVMGYSMGARITAFLTFAHPERVRSATFAGLGGNMVRPMAGTGPIAAALEAPSLEAVTNPTARTFRLFAEQTGSDLKALAACIRSARDPITPQALQAIQCPVLVAVGDQDVIAGPAADLARLLPKGEALVITGRDHMKAVGDRVYKEGVLAFLARRP